MGNKSDHMVKIKKESSMKIYEERKKRINNYLEKNQRKVSYYEVYKLFDIKGKAYFEKNHPELKNLVIEHNKKYDSDGTLKKDKDEIIRELRNKLKENDFLKKENESLKKKVLELLLENKALNEALQNILK